MRILLLTLFLTLSFESCVVNSVNSSATVTVNSKWTVRVDSNYDTISAKNLDNGEATFKTSGYKIRVNGTSILVNGKEVAAIAAGAKSVIFEQDEFRVQVERID